MPLSAPAPRAPLHNRTITCCGYEREDGLWDIEGRLVDTKTYVFSNSWRGHIRPGEALHEMWVRLTVDNKFTVVAIECATDNKPYSACGDIIPNFQRVVGQRIGPGWTNRIKAMIGGPQGCAHHVELISVLATVAFQTIGSALARGRKDDEPTAAAEKFVINTCHIWREGGERAREFFADPNAALAGGSPTTAD